MTNASKSEIDRLGVRLRKTLSANDLRMLDTYRRSFAPAYDFVVQKIRAIADIDVSGRPAKSTNAIADKLKRESIRLSQMQDIAGCRIVVEDIDRQDALTETLLGLFSAAIVSDRREKPSHGYRAVHIIISTNSGMVEVQVRTRLQHLWAEVSEKMADKFGIAVKYGGGTEEVREQIGILSEYVAILELLEVGARAGSAKMRLIEQGKTHIRTTLSELLTTAEAENDLSN